MPEDNSTTSKSSSITRSEPTEKTTTKTPTIKSSSNANSISKTDDSGLISEIVNKINESQNILIALSTDPSVDEMSAAIGLSLFLDKLGKRATAIYSGSTPNALEFLKPEKTFEPTVDALQDFVIALNKEKADHLRYKLDGDFVKIYITPYKTRISKDDLDFSYGDFNIDLVLALDVANGIDLDTALREHGRIMHDAVIVNITTGNPGKLGEIEWSDKTASSISEMVARLIYSMNSETKIEKDEATAFLTGVVAATNRFSNTKTTPEAMKIASRLMESGANQQLISKNITADIENEILDVATQNTSKTEIEESSEKDVTSLDIDHEEETTESKPEPEVNHAEEDSNLLDDLKAAEENLAQTVTKAEPENQIITSEKPTDINPNLNLPKTDKDFSKVLASSPVTNPAAMSAPTVSTNPEINGVPQINYMPLPGEEVLPPPPPPPIDMSSPITEPTPSSPISQPAMQDQVYNAQASNPGAFKIPGT